jgi:hypothetical protein
MSVTKQCVICHEHKDIADFHKKKNGKYGVNSRCKPCAYEYNKKYSDANIKRYRAKNREKINSQARERYAADPQKHINACKKSRAKHYDRYISYSRQYEATHKQERYEKNRKYIQVTPHKRLEFDLKKKVAKQQASVTWANEELIAKVYRLRDKLNKLAGYVKYHVDHEIPLRGKKVSGLHVENNLRIMLAKDNLSKGNRYTI